MNLFTNTGGNDPLPLTPSADTQRIIVLRQFRFHKKLCIELYEALTSREGRIKNPLKLMDPLNLVWRTEDPLLLKFYAGLMRFQHNPTAETDTTAIAAARAVLQNPQGFNFFYHDREFSENVTAGSLRRIEPGPEVEEGRVLVVKKDKEYEIRLSFRIEGQDLTWEELDLRYDLFFFRADRLHLLADLRLLQLARSFQPGKAIRVPEHQFNSFRQDVLARIEDRVRIDYTHIGPATDVQMEESGLKGAQEALIYLSEQPPYVLINPVMRYGSVEVPVLSKRQVLLPDGKGNTFRLERDEHYEINLIALLLQQHPDFEEQLESDLQHFYLHRDRFLNEGWFLQAFDNWKSRGITVLGFEAIKGNKLNANKASISVRIVSGINWFKTEIDARFGKQKAALLQLKKAVKNKSKYVQLDDGSHGLLPEEWLEKLSGFFATGELVDEELRTPKYQFATIGQMYEDNMIDEEVKNEVSSYKQKLGAAANIAPIPAPDDLQGNLRPYQLRGLAWLNYLDDQNFGGILADDMGLGKTVQLLAFVLHIKRKHENGTHLLVVPTSLLFNWTAEAKKFAPSLRILTLHGGSRLRDPKQFSGFDIVLTSYGTLLYDIHILKAFEFNYVFLDESQQIKNVDSQRYQAARLLRCRNRIVLTGTPVENNTMDLYAQLSFVLPGLLGNYRYFRDVYAIPIDQYGNRKRYLELQEKVAPFILRRTKQQVAGELPSKTETVLYCEMEAPQRAIYDAYEQQLRDYLAGKTEDELTKNTIHILKGLTRLRQICNSPRLIEEEQNFAQGSAKINSLLEQLEHRCSNHKVLVFSQFVGMLELIQEGLLKLGIGHALLTGSTQDRAAVVDSFRTDPGVRVFLISLKAGGTGLNLTEADYVYLVDPWWNPAVENQAIDRAYRIGQDKNVVAVRLICPGTVEERMMQLQERKRRLAEGLVREDDKLTNSELAGLIK
ncbi:MAG TPA: DEAD/DEAH box helicase [Flavisolibacter sp.]|nr:DEAD/DEAH box helicase [Flavisolibacter sp.]